MKKTLTLILLLPLFSLAQKDSICVLKGHINGLGNKKLIFSRLIDDPRFVMHSDHVRAHHDNFTYVVKLSEPTEFTFYYHKKKTKHKAGVFHWGGQIFLQNGNLTLTGLFDSLDKAVLKGSPLNDELLAEEREVNDLYDRLLKAEQKKDTSVKYLNKEQFQPVIEYINQYIRSHPSSYLSATLLYDHYGYDVQPQVSGQLLKVLDERIQASVPGRVFKKRLDIAMKTDVGKQSIDVTLPDMDGKPISLSSLRGKVTLLDFWASWCGPCRMENPNLVKAYKKYHEKGFEIYSVSLDVKKEAWKNAVAKDSLTWTHVSDLKGWKSDAAQLYGIKAIPSNVLIDRNGVVLAKNLREEELEKKLREIFK